MVRWVIDIVAAALLIVALLVACDRVPDIGRVLGGPTPTAMVKPAQPAQAPAQPAKAATPIPPPTAGKGYPTYPTPVLVGTPQSYPYPGRALPIPPVLNEYPYPSPSVPAKR